MTSIWASTSCDNQPFFCNCLRTISRFPMISLLFDAVHHDSASGNAKVIQSGPSSSSDLASRMASRISSRRSSDRVSICARTSGDNGPNFLSTYLRTLSARSHQSSLFFDASSSWLSPPEIVRLAIVRTRELRPASVQGSCRSTRSATPSGPYSLAHGRSVPVLPP